MRFIFYYCISTKIIVTIISVLRYNKKRKAMLTNLKYSFKTSLIAVILIIGNTLFAQNGLTITDNPVAAMLDSLANQKILEKALARPIYPKTNKFKYAEDSVPRFEDFVYESRLAKLDANSPFDLVYNPHVKGFIELYAMRRRTLVSRMMGLSQLYYPMFEEIFDRHNIPLELKHLAGYLPYGLKVIFDDRIGIISSIYLPAGNYNNNELWFVSLEEDKENSELSCSVLFSNIK